MKDNFYQLIRAMPQNKDIKLITLLIEKKLFIAMLTFIIFRKGNYT